jgi:hypothetical protein
MGIVETQPNKFDQSPGPVLLLVHTRDNSGPNGSTYVADNAGAEEGRRVLHLDINCFVLSL